MAEQATPGQLLHKAIFYGDAAVAFKGVDQAKEIIASDPDAVKYVDGGGWTTLHWAIYSARLEFVEMVMETDAGKAQVSAMETKGPNHGALTRDLWRVRCAGGPLW